MAQPEAPAAVKVTVTYAGSRKPPFQAETRPETLLSEVRTNAMAYFEIADSTDAAGNRIVFTLLQGNDPVDLTKTVGEVARHERHLNLRLVREVIAG